VASTATNSSTVHKTKATQEKLSSRKLSVGESVRKLGAPSIPVKTESGECHGKESGVAEVPHRESPSFGVFVHSSMARSSTYNSYYISDLDEEALAEHAASSYGEDDEVSKNDWNPLRKKRANHSEPPTLRLTLASSRLPPIHPQTRLTVPFVRPATAGTGTGVALSGSHELPAGSSSSESSDSLCLPQQKDDEMKAYDAERDLCKASLKHLGPSEHLRLARTESDRRPRTVFEYDPNGVEVVERSTRSKMTPSPEDSIVDLTG
jgi:hypothetical protein